MILASPHGGMNIEDVARDTPDDILNEPIDINKGITKEQAAKVATFMGFEAGDKHKQVWIAFDILNYIISM